MKSINLQSAVNKLSYGLVGCNILKALREQNIDVSLFIINQDNRNADVQFHKHIELSTKKSLYFDIEAPSLRIWHQFGMAESIGKGKRYGMPIFELDAFTKLEKHHLNSLDGILVCSKWAKEIVANNTNVKNKDIFVVPLGIDADIFRPMNVNKPNGTIFLNIGKWEYRKGHDFLIDCFRKAFTPNDDVQLWISSFSIHMSKQENESWAKRYKEHELGDKVKVIPRVESQKQLAFLINQATCGIFPSRAEGFNLGALEVLACGKPNIITNYSAHTEYSTQQNSFLVDVNEKEIAEDGIWFVPGENGLTNQGNWAKINEEQKEQIIEYMRNVHKNGVENLTKDCLKTAGEFTWNNTAKKIINSICL